MCEEVVHRHLSREDSLPKWWYPHMPSFHFPPPPSFVPSSNVATQRVVDGPRRRRFPGSGHEPQRRTAVGCFQATEGEISHQHNMQMSTGGYATPTDRVDVGDAFKPSFCVPYSVVFGRFVVKLKFPLFTLWDVLHMSYGLYYSHPDYTNQLFPARSAFSE